MAYAFQISGVVILTMIVPIYQMRKIVTTRKHVIPGCLLAVMEDVSIRLGLAMENQIVR
jgi:hypothetical protein